MAKSFSPGETSLRVFIAAAMFAIVSLAGCDDGRPQRVPVSGRVLIDGQPLTHGFVQVVPAGDRAASGKIGADGRFTLTTFEENDGCVLGTHAVAVIGLESMGAGAQKWHAPKIYASPETSGLTIDVTGPTDSIELNLTWDGGKPFIERFGEE